MARFKSTSLALSSLSCGVIVVSALLGGCGDGDAAFSQASVEAGGAGAANDAEDGSATDGGGKSGRPGQGSATKPVANAAGAPADAGDDATAGGAGGSSSVGGTSSAGAASAGAPAGGAGPAPVDPDALRIESFSCMHERAGLAGVTEGQYIDCRFDVQGAPGASVTLSCEDLQGKPIDCTSNSPRAHTGPDGAQPLPLKDASFFSATDTLGGSTLSMVIVASDGTETARHRLDVPIEADDHVPVAPTLSVDCGQAAGTNTVEVEVGTNLYCMALAIDPDPDMIEYSIDQVSVDAPTFLPIPYSGGLWGTSYFDWIFFTQPADVGKSFDYTFTVNDYVNAPAKVTITVVVK